MCDDEWDEDEPGRCSGVTGRLYCIIYVGLMEGNYRDGGISHTNSHTSYCVW